MMPVDADRYRRTVELFLRCCDAPAKEREDLLREGCVGDVDLAARVRAMLAQDEAPQDPLARAAGAAGDLLEDLDDEELLVPERIGSFRILSRLGEGGMGIVYEAEQESPRRIVALKIVRPGMTTPRNLRRFEFEADVLGRLEHAGIARIYGAGTADSPWGRVPYLALERLRGLDLAEHCARRVSSRRGKVELLVRVCEAVAYAHGQGVVHRDLKCSNVLVEENGQPKVLDFGIARLVEPESGAASAGIAGLTLDGQVLGTVATMSPEQLRGDLAHVDARTDVYALGAIAYELLAGRPHVDLAGKSLATATRIALEEEPPPLSTHAPACRGDLDVIVAKALAKDPAQRYASASALAQDLVRHLHDEPILARPPRAAELLAKFVRRNRTLVGAGVAIVAALAVGAGVATWKAIEATEQGQFARIQAYRSSLAAATAALHSLSVGEAAQHLDEADPGLRGWEWRHLRASLDESLGTIQVGSGEVVSLAVSPDSRWLATGSGDGSLRLWDLEAGGAAVAEQPGPRVAALRFAPAGDELLACRTTAAGPVGNHYGLPALDERSRWQTPLPACFNASWSNDASFLVWGARKGRLVALDAGTGRSLSESRCSTLDVAPVASPDGTRIALADPNGFEVRQLSDGATCFRRSDVGGSASIAYDPGGTRLVVSLMRPEARVCDASTGVDQLVLSTYSADVTEARFSPDGQGIATVTEDGMVRLWDARLGTLRRLWGGHRGRILDLEFSPDGRRLLTVGEDGTARSWNVADPDELEVLPHPTYVYPVAFSPDGRRLASGTLHYDGAALHLWDAASATRIAAWIKGPITCTAWSADGTRLAVGRHNAPTLLLDATTGAEIARLSGHFYHTDSVAFDPSGERVVSSGLDGQVHLFDAASGKMLKSSKLGPGRWVSDPIYRAAFAVDGSWIAASRGDGSIAILDGSTLDERTVLPAREGRLVSLAVSPDGRWLVSGSMHGELCIRRTEDFALVQSRRLHEGEIFALAFSPDCARLLSGGRDRAIRVWDTRGWEPVARLSAHTSYVYALSFSPDGHTLASSSGDGTVRLWDDRPRADRHRRSLEHARHLARATSILEEESSDSRGLERSIDRILERTGPDPDAREAALQLVLRTLVMGR